MHHAHSQWMRGSSVALQHAILLFLLYIACTPVVFNLITQAWNDKVIKQVSVHIVHLYFIATYHTLQLFKV